MPSRERIRDGVRILRGFGLVVRDDVRILRERLGGWSVRLYRAGVREYRGLNLRRVGSRLSREILASPALGRAAYVLVVLTWSAFVIWGRFLVPLSTTPYLRPEERFQAVAFFENGSGPEFPDSLPTLERYAKLFDVVSPFWYSVGPTGDLAGDGYRPEVVAAARSRGLKVIPLVGNLKSGPGNSFDAIRTDAARARTVDNLTTLAAARGYDGLNVDFELLPPEARPSYTAFVTSLATALHAQGRTLTVSVFPDVELSPAVSGFFDYRAIGQAADFIVLMAFDRHWSATGPGPVAPLPWVEASLDSLLKYVPARKVILGVGTHAYDWPTSAGSGIAEYLPTRVALQRAADAGSALRFDPESRQSTFAYASAGGAFREVWVQDGAQLADRAALARRRGLRGVAVWRLGFSEDGALERFGQAIGRAPGP